MDEVPKYRKKKPQGSKASKRADHKHRYVKTISMRKNIYDHSLLTFYWSTHCEICGRYGEYLGDDGLRKPGCEGLRGWVPDMYLSFDEIRERYPDIPVYGNQSGDLFEDVRIV